jgi:endonuclease/exonuclease/phosphatase family metal-dependent hydrolase
MRRWWLVILWVGCVWGSGAAEPVRLATYNLENYLIRPVGTRQEKSEASRAKVVEMIRTIRPDVLALQEVGGMEALQELQGRLRRAGVALPHQEWIQGSDDQIQVALLSRHPLVARRPHTNDAFLVGGRRFRVSRGILEADIQVAPRYVLTVMVAHLKSRRVVPGADQAEWRLAEARVLREKVLARLKAQPRANVVVMGDLNDTKGSEALRWLLGRGRDALVDTRPGERNGDTGYTPNPRWAPRTVTWTHYYGVEDSYGRVDYILLHGNAVREWVREASYLPVVPDWGLASDHRPVVVTLVAEER